VAVRLPASYSRFNLASQRRRSSMDNGCLLLGCCRGSPVRARARVPLLANLGLAKRGRSGEWCGCKQHHPIEFAARPRGGLRLFRVLGSATPLQKPPAYPPGA
jgi:hypothetical protein